MTSVPAARAPAGRTREPCTRCQRPGLCPCPAPEVPRGPLWATAYFWEDNFPSSQDDSGMNTVGKHPLVVKNGPAMEATQMHHGWAEVPTAVPPPEVLTLRTWRQAKTLLTQACNCRNSMSFPPRGNSKKQRQEGVRQEMRTNHNPGRPLNPSQEYRT